MRRVILRLLIILVAAHTVLAQIPAPAASSQSAAVVDAGDSGAEQLTITETPACEGCYLKSALVNETIRRIGR